MQLLLAAALAMTGTDPWTFAADAHTCWRFDLPKPPIVKPLPKPAFTPTAKLYAFTTRPAQGHTHTCANGHTWDHAVTAGHNCPYCGQSQYVQDRYPRPVTVRVAQPVQPVTLQSLQRQVTYTDCSSGQCRIVTVR